jgi:hypothetical protein
VLKLQKKISHTLTSIKGVAAWLSVKSLYGYRVVTSDDKKSGLDAIVRKSSQL